MKLSLRSKLLILLVLISLVPLAVLAGLGGYFINLAQQYSVARLEAQLLSQKEKEIEQFVTETQALFHVQVAVQVAALSGIPSDQREFLLREIGRANRAISEISFLEYDPTYPDKPETGRELSRMIGGELSLELRNRRNSPEFIAAMGGKDYFGPVYEKEGEYFMSVSSPVKNKDGIVIGAVSGELSLKNIARLVTDGALGNSGYVLLSDEKGIIWAMPSRLSFKGFGSNVFVQAVLGGEQGALARDTEEYLSSFGEQVVASAQRVKTLGWVLVAEWPKSDAYEVVYTIIRQAALFLVLILGMVVAAAFLFAWRIIKPIKMLEEGTRIVGSGNLDHRILINTKDELEVLANRFNEMAKNLKDIQELRDIKARMQGLVQSLEKEKELSRIKDTFIATASHQLRTPVSVIRWSAENLHALAAAGKKEEIESQLADLSKNVEALSLVIGDILTVAELGIGYVPRGISEFSVLEKVKEIIMKFTTEAEAKKITVAIDAREGEYRVKASPLNITRVLEHLMDNAVTYTKEGGHILFELSSSEKDLTVSVKDDGLEVLPEDQKLLFGEFFRGKNSVEMKNVGTGLGLFIMKTIVEGHGGNIGAESPADWNGKKAGSRFYFTLPLS